MCIRDSSVQNGVKLLNLYKPELIYEEKDILRRNPQLGKMIRLAPGKYNYVFDAFTHNLKIVDAQGEIYSLDTDLKAIPTRELQTAPREKPTKSTPSTGPKWYFEMLDSRHQKVVRNAETSLSANKVVLFDPQFVSRWGEQVKSLDKIWVMHWSIQGEEGDCLLSYLNANGEEINRINLREYFNDKWVGPYTATWYAGEVLIFVTKEYYTLSMLRTDSGSGRILGRVDYF
jgi:hypothetical protein